MMANPSSGTRSPLIRLLFVLAAAGCLAAVLAAFIYGRREPPQPPVFNPAPNPYAQGIYANGIVESDQAQGSNVSIYPEVSGVVARVLVAAGQAVQRGDVLVALDDSVPRAAAAQADAQALAAQALLEELRAQPRPETLAVTQAQLEAAAASERSARDSYDKLQHAFDIDHRAVSRDALDSARNAWSIAQANRATAQRQLDLTRAGAWSFDIRNQEAQVRALRDAADSAHALLAKYALHAPAAGRVLSLNVSAGTLVSPQGVYNPYTQASNDPALVFGSPPRTLQVRCYVDEILIPRLADAASLHAQMFVRGTTEAAALQFVRIEPFVSPKISLSDARSERVDVRVLPVLFRFEPDPKRPVYPGQLVDVYIGR